MLRCELIDGRPQLPPNTKWYRYEANGGPCWKTNERCFSLLEKDVLERKVIASIFRCEWLDVADELDHKIILMIRDGRRAEVGELHERQLDAEENSHLWRLWGEQKEWI